MPTNTALLIIDVQVGMFSLEKAIYDGDALLDRLAALIRKARQAHIPVIYVQNCGNIGDVLEPGAPGFPIHPRIAPQPTDLVILKRHPDAFQDTTLQDELAKRGIRRLVVAGLHTAYCIDTSCRRAYSLGYEVILVKDGHSTHDSDLLPAGQIIQHHNQVLSTFFVSLQSATDVEF